MQDRARLDLYVVALGRRRLQDVVFRGVSCLTRKHRKVGPDKLAVKRHRVPGPFGRNASIAYAFGENNLSAVAATIRRTNECLGSVMNDSDAERLSRLRHDLSNPLSALLAETQLLLLNEPNMDAETLTGLREIESLAIRMRTMLREL